MSRSFRHTFIIVLVSVGTALAAVGGWRFARASAPVAGPIIVLSIDTLRADRLPAYGYKDVRTPAIDSLAADGIVFERAYAHVPLTLPSHVSLLSGRLPFETGVRTNLGFAVRAEERLLPEMLRDRGFATAGIVSSYVLRAETGIAQGFDFFDADFGRDDAPAPAALQRDGAASEAVAERWLAAQDSARLFLFLHLYEPHKPYTPPARFAGLAPYDGEVAYADEIIGRLLRYLKSHQLYDQSTIVLVSDHGEGLGDHGEQAHGLFVYDEAVRVPLIIKQAGNVRAGERVSDLVQHVDLVPTVLDLAKAPVPEDLRGVSLTPLLDGTGSLPQRPAYSESLYAKYQFGWSALVSLTDGRYRYIRAPRRELYDLQLDPDQKENVAATRAPDGQALASTLDAMLTADAMPAPGPVDADVRERLGALGYVGTSGRAATPPGAAPVDPKDTVVIVETYRNAIEADQDRRWHDAAELLRQVLDADASLTDAWDYLAAVSMKAGRHADALEAHRRVAELDPARPGAHLGAAAAALALKRLDDARTYAELAMAPSTDGNARIIAAAHALLARIALARRDAAAAREEAGLAHTANPALAWRPYVDGRLLFDDGRYAEAVPLFEAAIAAVGDNPELQIADLHWHAAEALTRIRRDSDAEQEYLEELKYFPENARAHHALASRYHATDRPDAAADAIERMLRAVPTPDTYALAARLWTTFGDRRQADEVRAEARRLFEAPTMRGAGVAQH